MRAKRVGSPGDVLVKDMRAQPHPAEIIFVDLIRDRSHMPAALGQVNEQDLAGVSLHFF